jgi:peptide/nickel transport system ATP-binding protein
MSSPVLSVSDLSIEYSANRGRVRAVRNVSFDIMPGEAMALIGESGSGKTTIGTSIVRLLQSNASITSGSITYRRGARETNVLALNTRQLREFRWKECAMVFQGSLNAFNPVLRIADQFADTSRAHGGPQGRALETRSKQLLERVRLDPERAWRGFPHELSGGMRQRVLLALSLLLEPQLLILDEPTTALDVLTQRSILEVLRDLRSQLGFAMIFISHDLALAAELADRVATAYAGRIVEIGATRAVFARPRHPYTRGLIQAVPTLRTERHTLASIPGSPPDLIDLPGGCKFHPRCLFATERCKHDEPIAEKLGRDEVACWHVDAIANGSAVMTPSKTEAAR